MTRKAAEEMSHFAGIVVDCRLSLTSSSCLVLDGSTAAPSATLPTKTFSAAALPPAPACPHNRPKARTLPTQIQFHKDIIPTQLNISARPRQRTTPILATCLPPAAICAPIQRIPKRTGSAEHTGPEPPPAIPARRPRACPRPANRRAGADAGAGRDVPAGAAVVDALCVACAATAAFACVSAIGSTRAESGDWRRGGAGY
ncbi:hypothetical protein B0H13DRAFT_2669472 [Mycena leptocephala]|nr:hypothetical protein B0H13DRAFT_2669472 [Mycena leptocephala]